jgi:predicted DNA-binding antitoxin AbrB/MazE fold protein
MSFEVEAIYEAGILKLDRPLPLDEHQRVKIVVQEQLSIARQTYGIIGWTGEQDVVRKIALDPEFGVSESP